MCDENMLENFASISCHWRCSDEEIQQGPLCTRLHRQKRTWHHRWHGVEFNFEKVSLSIRGQSTTHSPNPKLHIPDCLSCAKQYSPFSHRFRRGRAALINSRKIQRPKRLEMVYLDVSPNYCDRDMSLGSLGTTDRYCNRTARGIDGCDLLCCGRGYNTHQINRKWQCRCKFQWCCHVQCEVCHEGLEQYTCK